MGLLVGLPLTLFRLLFVMLRLAIPVLLILLVIWLIRRNSRGGSSGPAQTRLTSSDGAATRNNLPSARGSRNPAVHNGRL